MKNINNFPDELSEMEQKIALNIKKIPVPVISQEEINNVCKIAASYYTEKQSICNMNFWKITFACLTIKSTFFWILSAFLLGTCVVISILITRYDIEPLAPMTALSPIPVLSFAIRELHYRDDNLVQIEKTCKYAPAKIYFTRIWLGMIFNILFVMFADTIVFSHYKNLLQLYFCSFIAMFFVGAVALFLLSFLDNALPLSLIMAIWVLGALYLLCQYEIFDAVINVSLTILIGILIFSLGLFAIAAIKSTTKLYAKL